MSLQILRHIKAHTLPFSVKLQLALRVLHKFSQSEGKL